MPFNVVCLLSLVAFFCILASVFNPPRVPLWVGALLLSIAQLLYCVGR